MPARPPKHLRGTRRRSGSLLGGRAGRTCVTTQGGTLLLWAHLAHHFRATPLSRELWAAALVQLGRGHHLAS